MKRFFQVVSLAACLLLVFAATASAVWKMEIEDKNVAANQLGVELKVIYSFDIKIVQATLPIVVKTGIEGAFWKVNPPLPFDTTNLDGEHYVNGVVWGTGVETWATIVREMRQGNGCVGTGMPYDGSSPDNFAISAQGTGSLSARQNFTWLTMTFDVNGIIGCFEFDTACFTTSLNKIFMIDGNIPNIDHGPPPGTNDVDWEPGVVCIIPNACPDQLGAYGSVLNGPELTPLSATHSGYHDPEGDPARFYKFSGPGTVNELTGAWNWTPQCGEAGPYTVVVEVSDNMHGEGGCGPNFHIQFSGVVTAIPVGIHCPADITVHWGDLASGTVTASTACTPVTFVQTGGPGGTLPGGAYSYQTPDPCQLGTFLVTETAYDNAQRMEQCTFNVIVTNELPSGTVPNAAFLYNVGYEIDLDDFIDDPDGVTFSNLTYVGPPGHPINPPVLNTSTGVVTWKYPDGTDAGEYDLTVDASDGCQSVTFPWHLTVQFVLPYKVSVLNPEAVAPFDLADHQVNTLSGRNAVIGLHMMNGFLEGSGAVDFLLCYDQSALAFKSAAKGPAIAGWEYFTYRYGPFGNACGSGCPSGYIRIIAIRDMNNGLTPPAGSEFVNGFIAWLTFYVSADRSLLNMCPRIGFCSIDCGDNTISDKSGNKLALAFPDQNDPEGYFITFGPDYDLEYCLHGWKVGPESFIYFDPGYICIRPPDDDRGDINLNGIANEVADAVLFTNYFIYGPSVWDPIWFENQILSTDINDDGVVLTVADLVYLIRIITGDAQPFPNSGEYKLSPYASSVDVTTQVVDGRMVVTTSSTTELGAGYLVFHYSGQIGTPSTGTSMTVKSNAANGELRVLVYSMSGNRIDAGVSELVSVPTEGTLELAEVSFSDALGSLMTVDMHRVAPPTAFELMQNYPNPFNASTVIRFALPTASDWSLSIYNVAGQIVKNFNGSSDAGYQSVTWNDDVASGIYFYKLSADDFTATKKMVLMK